MECEDGLLGKKTFTYNSTGTRKMQTTVHIWGRMVSVVGKQMGSSNLYENVITHIQKKQCILARWGKEREKGEGALRNHNHEKTLA